MMQISKEIIRSRGGVGEITMEELVMEVKKRGKMLVPDEVKASVVHQLKDFVVGGEKKS